MNEYGLWWSLVGVLLMAERLVMMIVVGARSGQQPLVYFISHSSACNAETDLTSVTIILQCFYSCISTMYKHSCRHRYREHHKFIWILTSTWYWQPMIACTSFYSSGSQWYDGDDQSYVLLHDTYVGLAYTPTQKSWIHTYPRGRKHS